MKTNVVMIRKMGQFEVSQRTKDGMFNATALLKQWNNHSGMQKQMSHFLENNNTKQFVQTIETKENAKQRNSVLYVSRGKSGGTWMHPFLFIDFAMWLNSEFKYEVIKFVYDQLIQFRHSAGDRYRSLTNAASKFKDADYRQLAKALNYIIFGKHQENLRQTATEEQLARLAEIENKMAFAVDMGYIKSFEELMIELRKIYHFNKAA